MNRRGLLAMFVSAAHAIAAGQAFAQATPTPTPTSPAPAPAPAPPQSAAPPAALAPRSAAPKAIGFEEAVRRATERNPNALVAAADVRRAEALLRQARAPAFPTAVANGVYTRLDDDRVFSNRVIAAANQISANAQVSVPILAPQRWAAWSRAADLIEVSRGNGAEVRRQVAISTARAYLTVIAQHRLVEAAERARDNARVHYDFAHTRRAGGLGNRIDEVRAAQELATSEAQVQTGLAALARAQEALGVLVANEGPLDADLQDIPKPEVPPPSGALDASIATRTDVRAFEARLHAAERSESFNYTDYLPSLTGVFQPFFQDPPTLAVPRTGWQAQLILSVPLYDGGLRYGLVRERAAATDAARAQLEGALRQARAEVRTAFEAVTRADEALRAARAAEELAEEARKLAEMAYRAGATTNLELTDAERRARDAATNAAIAEDEARQARLDLLAASGRFP
jgi:outer membrane protein TolC